METYAKKQVKYIKGDPLIRPDAITLRYMQGKPFFIDDEFKRAHEILNMMAGELADLALEGHLFKALDTDEIAEREGRKAG